MHRASPSTRVKNPPLLGWVACVTATHVASSARQVAVRVLYRVERDEAWAAPTLDAELDRLRLSTRDRALATAITYGTLRVVPELDAALAEWVRRDIGADAWLRALLRTSAFQLQHLGRLPARAVVHDAVTIATGERGKKVAGFVNAVLRRLAEHRPEHPSPPTRLSVPPWVHQALDASLGAERTRALLALDADAPTIDLRVTNPAQRAELVARIQQARPAATVLVGGLSPTAIKLRQAGDPRSLPGYETGEFAVQEEGAQVVGHLVDATADEHVVDACAGRGGKTGQLATAVGPQGSVTAFELHQGRLAQIPVELGRLGLQTPLELRSLDLTDDNLDLPARYDRVLVDAPCTGLGTIQRRPEILLRCTPADVALMATTQRAILRNAARLLKPGGLLLYAVCSPLRDEGPGAVPDLQESGLRPIPASRPWVLEGLSSDSDGWLRLGPWTPKAELSTDVYQVSRWTR